MTQQLINLGTADKGNGDPLRTAFDKVNQNFNELYTAIPYDSTTPNDWEGTAPITIQDAIDRLAAAFKATNGVGA